MATRLGRFAGDRENLRRVKKIIASRTLHECSRKSNLYKITHAI